MGLDSLVTLIGDFVEAKRNPEFRSRSELRSAADGGSGSSASALDVTTAAADGGTTAAAAARNRRRDAARRQSLQIIVGTVAHTHRRVSIFEFA